MMPNAVSINGPFSLVDNSRRDRCRVLIPIPIMYRIPFGTHKMTDYLERQVHQLRVNSTASWEVGYQTNPPQLSSSRAQ